MAYLGNSPGVSSQRNTTTITATAGQTTFTTTSGYQLGYIDVFLNGTKLVSGDDFTASNGTSITLALAANVGDAVELVSYTPRGLSDGYTKLEADAKYLIDNVSSINNLLDVDTATTSPTNGQTLIWSTASSRWLPGTIAGGVTSITGTADQIAASTSTGAITLSLPQSINITSSPSFANITLTGELRGPSTLIIDPAAIGDDTGTVRVRGNLQVDGTTTTVNSTTLEVADLNITLAKNAINAGAADGAGITVGGSSATLTYAAGTDTWNVNKNLLITPGTANGVLYLNGSKVATSGSALTFDGTNLGLGTTSPNTAGYGGPVLGIYGASSTGGNLWLTSDTTVAGNRAGRIGFGTEGNSSNKEIARVWSVAAGSTAGNLGGDLLFNTKADGGSLTERMRITAAGDVGIGTSSPLARLTVSDSTATNGTMTLGNNASYNGTLQYIFSTGELRISQVGGASLGTTFYTAGTERLRIDASGNLGLGVTPSAWSVSGKVFEFGFSGANASLFQNGINDTHFTSNSYYNGTSWIYNKTGTATRFYQGGGLFTFSNAASGTAGTNLTWSERVRIDSTGNVLPGADNAQDLGSFTARWRNIYTADMHFSNYGSQNSVDGTWGNWTLQEGEENIYMLNNRTGRKYKIVLEEV